jgi:hypothetical protein
LLLILSLLLNLKSRSIDFPLVLSQAPIDVRTLIALPSGSEVDGDDKDDIFLKLQIYMAGIKLGKTDPKHCTLTFFLWLQAIQR